MPRPATGSHYHSDNPYTEQSWPPPGQSYPPSSSSASIASSESDYYPMRVDHSGHIAIDMGHPTHGPMSNRGAGLYNLENQRFYTKSPDNVVEFWDGKNKRWMPENVSAWRELAMDAFPLLMQGVGKLVTSTSGPYIYAGGVAASGLNGLNAAAQEVRNYVRGEQANLNRALGGATMLAGAGLYGAGNLPTVSPSTGNFLQGVGATLQSVGTGLKGGADISKAAQQSSPHSHRVERPEPRPMPGANAAFNPRVAARGPAPTSSSHHAHTHTHASTATSYSARTPLLPQMPAPSARTAR